MSDIATLFAQLGAARKRNIELFSALAECSDGSVAFVARDPEAKDVTLEIMRSAAARCPRTAALLIGNILKNDLDVVAIGQEIVAALRSQAKGAA